MDRTVRGFVLKIEIGRGGLVTVTLLFEDGTTAEFVIDDLDADPERFNERLSKLAILRDAMNRAEPVEIEWLDSESGRVIDRAARITRDALESVGQIVRITGLLIEVRVLAQNRAAGDGEARDHARVSLLTSDLVPRQLVLDLQAPERLVVAKQLQMLNEAEAQARLVILWVDEREDPGRIVAVALGDDLESIGGERGLDVDGFVESLGLIRLQAVAVATRDFAHVRFTTAPPFAGPGNVVGLDPFAPTLIHLLAPKRSVTYDLFEAGLRDNLRMRVRVLLANRDRPGPNDEDAGDEPGHDVGGVDADRAPVLGGRAPVGIALAAELLAPLASASRPVWITISRESLDHGPDGFACTAGMPTSDLTPMGLRDLRIPYPAVWTGTGCFNPGVYRFQLQMPSPFTLSVDGEPLCLYDSTREGITLAHACLDGDHTVTVALDAWTCDDEFVLDVYRLR